MEKSYSQAGQDVFVLSLFNKNYKGTFVDVGCQMPFNINNTLLLEENGWTGISFDIVDYGNAWISRRTPFICGDALILNYAELFNKYNLPKIIDYLSLDIEGDGTRFQALKKVIESGYEFKVMTVEHDAYRGYDLTERQPQRKYLNELGYLLLCSDMYIDKINPMEDWWINPKYFNIDDYQHIMCKDLSYKEILEKIKNK